MNDISSRLESGGNPSFAPRQGRRWLRTVLLSLVLLVSGGAIGSGVTVVVLVHRMHSWIHHPDQFARRVTSLLRRPLSLSDDQARQVESILREHQKKIQAVRREAQPKVQEQLNEMRREVAAVLTPPQAEKWTRWLDNRRQTWLPPLPASAESP